MDGSSVPLHTRAIRLGLDVANGRHPLSRFVPALLLVFDAVLCALVIWKVPCRFPALSFRERGELILDAVDTEIDWMAYMEQIELFLGGEKDYTRIEGGTGPLVYPAAHVYTYTALYYVTDQGKNIFLAQCIFAGLYLATLALVIACYRKAGVGVPPTNNW